MSELHENLVGVGLRSPHYKDLFETLPQLSFVEVHPENYFCGGLHLEALDEAAENYDISLHGVGLSLGSTDPVDKNHLIELKRLVDRYDPALVSDHVSWSTSGNAHLGDLLPLPYNQESLDNISEHIMQTQDFLGRQILVENPSSYLSFAHSTMTEPEFMAAIVEKTGCGILLDVNNIYVQSHNHSLNASEYFAFLDPDSVQEYHLAGHISEGEGDEKILIDTHNQKVTDGVWKLYGKALDIIGKKRTLIEWDSDIPEFNTLLGEADKASKIISNMAQEAALTEQV